MSHASPIDQTHRALPVPEPAFASDDGEAILRFAVDALHGGIATALVTLVEIRGGASRPLGAQMAVRADGRYCGYVSGGCIEAAAAYEALAALRSSEDRTVQYGAGSPWFDIVLPCGGGITLAVHPLRSAEPLQTVLNALAQRRTAGLRHCPASQSLEAMLLSAPTGWDGAAFNLCFRPRPRVVIAGGSLEADAVAQVAAAVGYDVQRCTDASAVAIDTDTAVVMLFHDLYRELPLLEAALTATPFYLGALGSQRTHRVRAETLAARGWQAADIARIKAPIGLFPKARDAGSLALSVLADVAAARLVQLHTGHLR